jgi:ankyrin repeat protein
MLITHRATPLHYAASAGAAKAMAALLDAGADASRADGRGATALHRASACNVGEECVGLLLDRGAAVGAQDEAGATPLHVAILAGIQNTVLLFIKRGASLAVCPPSRCQRFSRSVSCLVHS